MTVAASANNPDQVYFNGVVQPVVSQGTVWNGTIPYTGTGFEIGQSLSSNWPFIGSLDEVQVYNAALSQSEVQAIYNAGAAGMCP